jgi:hypothetical protein
MISRDFFITKTGYCKMIRFAISIFIMIILLLLGTCSHISESPATLSGGSIFGYLTDTTGASSSMNNHMVWLVETGDSVLSNWFGYFFFGNLPPDTYTVAADASHQITVIINSGETTFVQLMFPTDTVRAPLHIQNLYILHDGTNACAPVQNEWYLPIKTFYTTEDSVGLSVSILTRGTVRAVHNGKMLDQICDSTYKGCFFNIVRTGMDTIEFYQECAISSVDGKSLCAQDRIVILDPDTAHKRVVGTEAAIGSLKVFDAATKSVIWGPVTADNIGESAVITADSVYFEYQPGFLYDRSILAYDELILYQDDTAAPAFIRTPVVQCNGNDSLVIISNSYYTDSVTKAVPRSCLRLRAPADVPPDTAAFFPNLFISDARADTCIAATGRPGDSIMSIITSTDSVTVHLWTEGLLADKALRVYLNGRLIDTRKPGTRTSNQSSMYSIGLPVSGCDTLHFLTDPFVSGTTWSLYSFRLRIAQPSSGIPESAFCICDSSPVTIPALNALVCITTGAATLSRLADTTMVTSAKIFINSDSLFFKYNRVSVIDWDVYVVAPSGDTCYWGNRTINRTDLSMQLWDNHCWIDSTMVKPELRYTSDKLWLTKGMAGIYMVYVKYHDGPADSLSATPNVLVSLGTPPAGTPILSVYELQPSFPIDKGEVWLIGEIHIPEMTFQPAGPVSMAKLKMSTGD